MTRGPKILSRTRPDGVVIQTPRDCPQPAGRGPNGRRLCRWCHDEVPVGRQTFCCSSCVEAFRLECDPAHLRWLVNRRDRGICACCGLDTRRLERAAGWANRDQHDYPGPAGPWRWNGPGSHALMELGFNQNQSLWQADHKVPLAEGGTNSLENLRTLCCPCHKAETARLARRLAERRRDQRAELFCGGGTA